MALPKKPSLPHAAPMSEKNLVESPREIAPVGVGVRSACRDHDPVRHAQTSDEPLSRSLRREPVFDENHMQNGSVYVLRRISPPLPLRYRVLGTSVDLSTPAGALTPPGHLHR